jgi:hypothetical protein
MKKSTHRPRFQFEIEATLQSCSSTGGRSKFTATVVSTMGDTYTGQVDWDRGKKLWQFTGQKCFVVIAPAATKAKFDKFVRFTFKTVVQL